MLPAATSRFGLRWSRTNRCRRLRTALLWSVRRTDSKRADTIALEGHGRIQKARLFATKLRRAFDERNCDAATTATLCRAATINSTGSATAPVAKEETPLLWKDWPEVKKRDFITRNYGAEATSDPASPRQQKQPQPQPQPRQVEPPAVAASAASATMAIEYYAHGGLYYEANWTSASDTCGTEAHADYDGTASFSWGYGPKGLKAQTAGECCDHCRKNAKCNTWVWCGEPFCFAPDVWNHSFGECWLKANPIRPCQRSTCAAATRPSTARGTRTRTSRTMRRCLCSGRAA